MSLALLAAPALERSLRDQTAALLRMEQRLSATPPAPLPLAVAVLLLTTADALRVRADELDALLDEPGLRDALRLMRPSLLEAARDSRAASEAMARALERAATTGAEDPLEIGAALADGNALRRAPAQLARTRSL